MVCPKCKETTLRKIIFKKSQQTAYLCGACGALWLEGELISEHTGHTIRLYSHQEDKEYTFDDEENNLNMRSRKEENLDV